MVTLRVLPFPVGDEVTSRSGSPSNRRAPEPKSDTALWGGERLNGYANAPQTRGNQRTTRFGMGWFAAENGHEIGCLAQPEKRDGGHEIAGADRSLESGIHQGLEQFLLG